MKQILMPILNALNLAVEKLAKFFLVSGLAAMLILTLTNIVLRWFGETILWIEPVVRHLVFISAFLGGVLATSSRNHIRIDLFARALDSRNAVKLKIYLESTIYLFSSATLVWMVISGIALTKIEFEFGKQGFLDIHSGYLVAIIPVGLSLIAFRFFTLFIETIATRNK